MDLKIRMWYVQLKPLLSKFVKWQGIQQLSQKVEATSFFVHEGSQILFGGKEALRWRNIALGAKDQPFSSTLSSKSNSVWP